MGNKWEYTMAVMDSFERRFARARAAKPLRKPHLAADRAEILTEVKKILGYEERFVPQIRDMEEISVRQYDGYRSIQYRYRTWKHFYGSATLYLPATEETHITMPEDGISLAEVAQTEAILK